MTRPVEPKVVEEVFVNYCQVLYVTARGQRIETTSEHPFFVIARGWVPAAELNIGDVLASHDGQDMAVEVGDWQVAYNLRVQGYHTYFVGCPGWGFTAWAHNAYVVKGGLGPPPKGGWKNDTFAELGVTITCSSASSEGGKTIAELSAGIRNGQIRVSSTEVIAVAGGAVVPTRRSPINPYYVTIIGLTLEKMDIVFGPPIPNPGKP